VEAISAELATKLDLLDDEALTPADEGDRNTWKPEAAHAADLWLRRLARREALGRVVLGRIADVFLIRGAHHALGFARVGDYTRERLGLSPSQFYELARVARELRQLPRVSEAFDRGELGWTKVRELAGTATAESEDDWLRVATAYTADGLKLAVRSFKEGSVWADDASASPAESATTAVRAAVKRHGGLTAGDADELRAVLEEDEVDGEPSATLRIRCPTRVLRLWKRTRELACRVAGAELPDWAAAEAIAAENVSAGCAAVPGLSRAVDVASRRNLPRSLKERHFKEGVGPEPELDRADDFDIIDSLRWDNDHRSIADALPDELACLADHATDASPHELDRRMRLVLTAMARVDWQLGRLLRTIFALRLQWELGYMSEGSYVRNRLGMCSRKARALVALDRRSWQSSLALTDAYRQGRLSWYRCLMIMPVVNDANIDAWLARACEVPARRLHDEVEWALEVIGNSPLGSRPMPPPSGHALDTWPCVHCGDEHSEAELDGSATVQAERQIRGHEGHACIAVRYANEALANAVVQIRGPASVISLLQGVITQNRKVAEPLWRGFERALHHAETQWASLPKHRDPVFERDGWRCTAPACSSRRNLEDHHVIYRSRGGSGARTNRTAVCAWHHHRGIHAGRVRVSGTADGRLCWELGLRRDEPPLLTVRGDSYVNETEKGTVRVQAP
jgi:hypothetical protein